MPYAHVPYKSDKYVTKNEQMEYCFGFSFDFYSTMHIPAQKIILYILTLYIQGRVSLASKDFE